jgi:hypothetical protein
MDFFAFSHGFSTQKSFLSQRDHSHTVRLAKAQITRMLGQFLKNLSFMLHQSGKNNKLGSVKNSRDLRDSFSNERFKRISQKV